MPKRFSTGTPSSYIEEVVNYYRSGRDGNFPYSTENLVEREWLRESPLKKQIAFLFELSIKHAEAKEADEIMQKNADPLAFQNWEAAQKAAKEHHTDYEYAIIKHMNALISKLIDLKSNKAKLVSALLTLQLVEYFTDEPIAGGVLISWMAHEKIAENFIGLVGELRLKPIEEIPLLQQACDNNAHPSAVIMKRLQDLMMQRQETTSFSLSTLYEKSTSLVVLRSNIWWQPVPWVKENVGLILKEVRKEDGDFQRFCKKLGVDKATIDAFIKKLILDYMYADEWPNNEKRILRDCFNVNELPDSARLSPVARDKYWASSAFVMHENDGSNNLDSKNITKNKTQVNEAIQEWRSPGAQAIIYEAALDQKTQFGTAIYAKTSKVEMNFSGFVAGASKLTGNSQSRTGAINFNATVAIERVLARFRALPEPEFDGAKACISTPAAPAKIVGSSNMYGAIAPAAVVDPQTNGNGPGFELKSLDGK